MSKVEFRPRRTLPELFGTAEVADCLDVRVQNLQFIKDLPEPVQRVKATRLWLASEIRQFAKIYEQRRPKRAA